MLRCTFHVDTIFAKFHRQPANTLDFSLGTVIKIRRLINSLLDGSVKFESNILFRKPSEQHPTASNSTRFGPIYSLYTHQCHLIRWPIKSNNAYIGQQFCVNSVLSLDTPDSPSIGIPTLHRFSFDYYV